MSATAHIDADPSRRPALEKCSSCGHTCGYHFTLDGRTIPCDADDLSHVRDCGCEQYTYLAEERRRPHPRRRPMSADRLEIYRDDAGKWRFRRRARNGEIGNPSQGYSRRWNALVGAVRWNPDVYRENVVDLTRGGLRVRSKALRWLRSREEG